MSEISDTTKGKGIDIVNGPSKFDLMMALFVTKPDNPKVTFATKKDGDIACSIMGVKKEDGSGDSWVIEGYVIVRDESLVRFAGWFNTQRRCGHIYFVD